MKLGWEVGAATATMVVAGGVAVIDWKGLLTPGLMKSMGLEIEQALEGQAADALLIRLDRAVIAVSLEEMVAFFKSPVRSALKRAGAVVVDEVSLPLFRDLCWHVCQLGVIRKPFTCAERASAWAQEMAELQAAQAEFEARKERRRELALRLPRSGRTPRLSARMRPASLGR